MLLLAALLAAPVAHAQVPVSTPASTSGAPKERQGGMFGLGFGMGAPSGLAGKIWFSPASALQFTAGGDMGRNGDLAVTADYTRHFRPFNTEGDIYSVPLHLGVGMNLGSNLYENAGKILLGPRVVAGATVLITELPVDLFMEVAPTLYVYEDFTWSVDGQLGVRYYF